MEASGQNEKVGKYEVIKEQAKLLRNYRNETLCPEDMLHYFWLLNSCSVPSDKRKLGLQIDEV